MRNEKGFTLIELLVVIAIVGILSVIAIYQFAFYQQQAICSRVESDVKNTVTALEAFYAQNETYTGFTVVVQSAGVTVTPNAAGNTLTSVTGTHPTCDQNSDGSAGDTFTFTGATGQYSW
jgi:prepilin-type N-terminal cleavage/methylation domain-containing protein